MNVYIAAIGTAVPPYKMNQEEVFEAFKKHHRMTPAEESFYRKLMESNVIEERSFGIDRPDEVSETDADRLNERFLKHGLSVASAAVSDCLRKASISAEEIDCLVVNTCTGYLCPGLSSYLIEKTGFRSDIRIFDIMGMGCGSALPCLETAGNFLTANSGKKALAVSFEICSSTLFMGEDPGLIVSNAIFADGASAVLLKSDSGFLKILGFESRVYPEHREKLRYRTETHRLRNVLDMEVPRIGAAACREVVESLLRSQGMKKDSVAGWAVHPGGSAVLDEVITEMGLVRKDLESSYRIFNNHGNMSSPSVMFVLDDLLRSNHFESGDKIVCAAFGAGFSAFGALIEVCL